MPNYRFERPQAGRFREFWQFGIEVLGDSDPAIDAEVIELGWRVLESFGITDVTLLLNSIGDKRTRPEYLEALKTYFAPHVAGLSRDDQRRLGENTLRVLDSKDEEIQPLLPDAPKSLDYLSDEAKAHWEGLLGHLDGIGIDYEIEHTLVRGLDYYTHTVFEFVPADARRTSTLVAGGRYDGLIEELGGQPTPGIGFAMGIERVVAEAKKRGTLGEPNKPTKVLIAHLGDAAKASGVQLASELRRSGVAAVLGPPRGLRSQLRYATSIDATHAIVIGDDELAKGVVMLRDLSKGEQEEVARDGIVGSLE
jgi:histidyl-tRNA synthetase